jgi:Rieske Fe-S protein
MKRRTFIKTSCSLTLALGGAMATAGLSSCSSLPIHETTMEGNRLSLSQSLFTDAAPHIVRAKGLAYDISVRRQTDGSYTALLLRCTHADNQLNTNANGFACALHGSAYDNEGRVTRGPAQRALQRLRTELTASEVVIHLSE